MNTLREIVAFTGVLNNAGQHVGGTPRKPTMRTVGNMMPLLNSNEKTSMRALILSTQRLPPITLEAELVGETTIVPPFLPDIRVHPSSGVVVETVLNYFLGGQRVNTFLEVETGLLDGDEVLPGDNRTAVRITLSDPGDYTAVLTRTGITSTGVTVLEKKFTFTIRAKASPPPPTHPPPPQPLVTCSVELAPDPGQGGFTNMRIFGGGFQPREQVNIIDENNEILSAPAADQLGLYSVTNSFVATFPPTQHTAQAHGQTSGRISNIAGFFV